MRGGYFQQVAQPVAAGSRSLVPARRVPTRASDVPSAERFDAAVNIALAATAGDAKPVVHNTRSEQALIKTQKSKLPPGPRKERHGDDLRAQPESKRDVRVYDHIEPMRNQPPSRLNVPVDDAEFVSSLAADLNVNASPIVASRSPPVDSTSLPASPIVSPPSDAILIEPPARNPSMSQTRSASDASGDDQAPPPIVEALLSSRLPPQFPPTSQTTTPQQSRPADQEAGTLKIGVIEVRVSPTQQPIEAKLRVEMPTHSTAPLSRELRSPFGLRQG